jgi:preprotein translocase subunit SecE
VARDRKRAKQRRDRAAAVARRPGAAERTDGDANGDGATNGASAVSPDAPSPQAEPVDVEPTRDTPASLAGDHIAGAFGGGGGAGWRGPADFDEALLRGAGGTPITSDQDELEFEAEAEDTLQESAGPGGGSSGGGGSGSGGGGGGGGRRGEGAGGVSGAPLRGGNRAIGFLRASWAELQRVQWPDRRQVTQATAVVLGFVAIAGVYLGVADTVAKEIVEFIL